MCSDVEVACSRAAVLAMARWLKPPNIHLPVSFQPQTVAQNNAATKAAAPVPVAAPETPIKADPELAKKLAADVTEQVRVTTATSRQINRRLEWSNCRQLSSARYSACHCRAASPSLPQLCLALPREPLEWGWGRGI